MRFPAFGAFRPVHTAQILVYTCVSIMESDLRVFDVFPPAL